MYGASGLVGVPIVLAVLVIVLGLRPQLDAALYRTIVVLILLSAGGTLLGLVFSRNPPPAA